MLEAEREGMGKRPEAQATSSEPKESRDRQWLRAPIPNSSYLALQLIFEIVLFQSEPGCIVLEFLNFTAVLQRL